MAKLISYDISDVEESQGGTGVKVPTGVRVAKIALCEQREKKANGDPANDIRVGLNFGEAYDWGFTYIGLSEASDWKLAEFIRALDLPKKGRLDPTKQVGKFIRVKVNHDEYEGEYSPNMGRLMRPQDGDDEAWAEGNGSASFISASADGPDEDTSAAVGTADDTAYREGEPSPENPEEIVGSYDDWSDEDLEVEAEERGVTIVGGRGSKRNKIIKTLRDDDLAYKEGGVEEEEEGDSEEADYDGWDIDRLKQEWEDRQMGDLPEIKGRNAAGRLKTAIIESLQADDKENPFEA